MTTTNNNAEVLGLTEAIVYSKYAKATKTNNTSGLTSVKFELNGKSYKSAEGLRFYELKNSRWVRANDNDYSIYRLLLSAFKKEVLRNPRTMGERLDARFANSTLAIVKVS